MDIKRDESWLQPNGLYKCPLCNKEYSKNGICSHMFFAHTERGRNHHPTATFLAKECTKFEYCKFCNKEFKSIGYKVAHEKKCKSNPVYLELKEICPTCGKLFFKKNLLKHIESKHIERTYLCKKCGNEFTSSRRFRSNRYKHCPNCIQKFAHVKKEKEIKNIFDLSKRTIAKLLKRAKTKCAICEWNESTCDIHHIIPKKRVDQIIMIT